MLFKGGAVTLLLGFLKYIVSSSVVVDNKNDKATCPPPITLFTTPCRGNKGDDLDPPPDDDVCVFDTI